MNKTKQIMVAVLAAIIIGGGGFVLYNNSNDDSQGTPSSTQTVQQTNVEPEKPKITSSDDKKTVSYDGQTGKKALELLQSGAEVTTESSDFGDFVTGINGLQAEAGKNYWSFYINGAYASEGAGTYETKDGEKIEWRLEDL